MDYTEIFETIYPALQTYVGEKRKLHILSVTRQAQEMCKLLGQMQLCREATIAALLHDITKELPHDRQCELANKYALDLTDEDYGTPSVMHAFTAAPFSRELFPALVNEQVYSAIFYHSTGRAAMTDLEKIIFVADFIEPTRTYPACRALHDEFHENHTLDRAVLAELSFTVDFLSANRLPINPRTLYAQEYYMQKEL